MLTHDYRTAVITRCGPERIFPRRLWTCDELARNALRLEALAVGPVTSFHELTPRPTAIADSPVTDNVEDELMRRFKSPAATGLVGDRRRWESPAAARARTVTTFRSTTIHNRVLHHGPLLPESRVV